MLGLAMPREAMLEEKLTGMQYLGENLVVIKLSTIYV